MRYRNRAKYTYGSFEQLPLTIPPQLHSGNKRQFCGGALDLRTALTTSAMSRGFELVVKVAHKGWDRAFYQRTNSRSSKKKLPKYRRAVASSCFLLGNLDAWCPR